MVEYTQEYENISCYSVEKFRIDNLVILRSIMVNEKCRLCIETKVIEYPYFL